GQSLTFLHSTPKSLWVSALSLHDALPIFIDSGVADGFLYYVMPYVEGESLRQRLEREGQLPLDEALRLTRAIASALDFAHGRGVDRKSTRLNSSHVSISYAVFCLKKKT